MPKTIVPIPLASSYTCPFCETTSTVNWYGISHAQQAKLSDELDNGIDSHSPKPKGYYHTIINSFGSSSAELHDWAFAECNHCKKMTVWHKDKMVYPSTCPVDPPNPDMPEKVKDCYLEAAQVLNASPRSAAALLRLGLQHLLAQLLDDEGSGHLYTDIIRYSQNAPIQIVKALDIIRVTGNNSVHPGTIDLDEEPERAEYLFILMNMICDESISRPKLLEEAYQRLPESKRIIQE